MLTFKWVNRDPQWRTMIRVETNIERTSGEAARVVAEALAQDIRSNWSSTYIPNDFGNPPSIESGGRKNRTPGNLDSSVIVDDQGRDSLGRFATDAKIFFVRTDTSKGDNPEGRGNYAAALEDPNYKYKRPFTEAAINRMQDIFPAIYKRMIKP